MRGKITSIRHLRVSWVETEEGRFAGWFGGHIPVFSVEEGKREIKKLLKENKHGMLEYFNGYEWLPYDEKGENVAIDTREDEARVGVR